MLHYSKICLQEWLLKLFCFQVSCPFRQTSPPSADRTSSSTSTTHPSTATPRTPLRRWRRRGSCSRTRTQSSPRRSSRRHRPTQWPRCKAGNLIRPSRTSSDACKRSFCMRARAWRHHLTSSSSSSQRFNLTDHPLTHTGKICASLTPFAVTYYYLRRLHKGLR